MKEIRKTLRIQIPPEVRKYVFSRDSYQCQSCGKTHQETELTIDHIIALARGGTNDISNLQTLCRCCNQQKKHHFDCLALASQLKKPALTTDRAWNSLNLAVEIRLIR